METRRYKTQKILLVIAFCIIVTSEICYSYDPNCYYATYEGEIQISSAQFISYMVNRDGQMLVGGKLGISQLHLCKVSATGKVWNGNLYVENYQIIGNVNRVIGTVKLIGDQLILIGDDQIIYTITGNYDLVTLSNDEDTRNLANLVDRRVLINGQITYGEDFCAEINFNGKITVID